jgi:hypothetical protein
MHEGGSVGHEHESTPLQKLRDLSKSGITQYKATPEELANVKAKELANVKEEEVYDPIRNRSNEDLIGYIQTGAENIKNWFSFFDKPAEVAPTKVTPIELESTQEADTVVEPDTIEVEQTGTSVKPVDVQTKIALQEADASLLYPNVLDSNKAMYGELWGRAFHTEAENDAAKQLDYKKDVELYVVPNSNYVNTMVPILNKVIPAFEGDSNVKGDILYRAMLEIGAHESEGATDLYNEKSHASGVFQTLTSTVRDTAKDSDYYGPKAQELTGKSRQEVSKMTAAQIQNWMQTDFTANAVFGAIELIKLAKGLENKGEGNYLRQLTGPPEEEDKTDWANAIT